MRAPEEVSRENPQVRMEVGNRESVLDALLEAAERAGVDVYDHPTRLNDVADGDALDKLFPGKRSETAEYECTVYLRVWDRTFVVKPDVVEVYPSAEI